MEKVEYDLDTSGGLMEEIQALIAPPISEEHKRRVARHERETSKRFGGRTVNRDCCDSCSEGGDLLCCDRCPASFHFNCCDPPLDEDDIPTGEWICIECRTSIKDDVMASQSESNSACPSPSSETSNPSQSQSGFLNPFSKLAEASKNKNPREFSLPNELENFTIFPRDRKRKEDDKEFGYRYKKRDEADVPDRFCFQCSRLSKCMDLLFCDFCPLAFHPDCLSPPLTMPPTSLWLCPCHPEHFEPELQDPRYSRRAEMIDAIRGVVSQQAVKMNFISKAKRMRILNNRKSNQRKRRMTVIPASIKEQYRHPPALSVPDFIREMQEPLYGHHQPISLPSQVDKEEWLKFIVRLHCDIAATLSKSTVQKQKSSSPSAIDPSGTTPTKVCDHVSTEKMVGVGQQTSPSDTEVPVNHPTPVSYGECSTDEIKHCVVPAASQSATVSLMLPTKPSAGVVPAKVSSSSSNAKIIILATQNPSNTSKILSDSSPSTAAIGNVSVSSPQILSQCKKGAVTVSAAAKPQHVASSGNSACGSTHVVNSVTADTLQDPTLSQLDDRLVRVLAFQRLQQLLGQTKVPTEVVSAAHPAPVTAVFAKKSTKQLTVDVLAVNDEAIAVLSPMSGAGKPFRMNYRTISIGSGNDNDIVLLQNGFCNFVTGKHACIFYDQETRQFELLNYSEHGTIVDNVLYSCDFSLLKSCGGSEVISSNAKFPVTGKFFDGNRRGKLTTSDRYTKGLGSEVLTQPCRCRASGSSVIGSSGAGWEGTAVLHHGSYLKFGCLHFVFSIVDCATEKPSHIQSPSGKVVK